MGRDASLDEFVGGDDGDDTAGTTGTAAEEAADGAEADDSMGDTPGDDTPEAASEATASGSGDGPAVSASDADPATVTCEWSPSGAACSACGATVKRRWRGDAGPVCPDCKDW